jgi:hypothetical protein
MWEKDRMRKNSIKDVRYVLSAMPEGIACTFLRPKYLLKHLVLEHIYYKKV